MRYDVKSGKRLKTVELIVGATDWTPPPSQYASENIVSLRISASDMRLRTLVKATGGRWKPEKRLWFVEFGNIASTLLEKHIHVDEKDQQK